MVICTGLAPEIAPFPAAQVQLAGLRLLAIQQPLGASEVVRRQRLLDQIHVGDVGGAAGGKGLGLGPLAFCFGPKAFCFGPCPLLLLTVQ